MKVGTVVQLRSGGPEMTVAGMELFVEDETERGVEVFWMVQGALKRSSFPPAMLKVVRGPED